MWIEEYSTPIIPHTGDVMIHLMRVSGNVPVGVKSRTPQLIGRSSIIDMNPKINEEKRSLGSPRTTVTLHLDTHGITNPRACTCAPRAVKLTQAKIRRQQYVIPSQPTKYFAWTTRFSIASFLSGRANVTYPQVTCAQHFLETQESMH